ncbi:hypothetical protein OH799_07385 [Nocardia sp. NBC_00881]|uniref:hypothetical protein n=1 Tax=Nocardia sp. NBC_00881 TaxID=2975995 RepID=UPI00386779F4|nr:hypothetical protein OH799_07385 [Nocardia sp. NBC_00881]
MPENGTARVRLACIEARARARIRDAQGADEPLELGCREVGNPIERARPSFLIFSRVRQALV